MVKRSLRSRTESNSAAARTRGGPRAIARRRSRCRAARAPLPAHAGPRRRRGGFLTSAELVLVLPILAVLLAGLVEFSLLFFARGEIVDAARAAARIASFPGATDLDVEREVRRTLSPRLQRGMK
ncbi:MAG: pilus assembly protein, partial [Planctomycetota bacterium]